MQEYSRITTKTYTQTIDTLKEKLSEKKFGVLSAIDLPEKFKEKGLRYHGAFTLLEICNPFEAHTALLLNPKVVFFLPCKLVVRESDGFGVIEMIRPSSMISELGDTSLDQFALRIENTLIDVIESV
ncbi:MAG: DUF302 domain-containing protein [Erysipelotrichaceae bacterium]